MWQQNFQPLRLVTPMMFRMVTSWLWIQVCSRTMSWLCQGWVLRAWRWLPLCSWDIWSTFASCKVLHQGKLSNLYVRNWQILCEAAPMTWAHLREPAIVESQIRFLPRSASHLGRLSLICQFENVGLITKVCVYFLCFQSRLIMPSFCSLLNFGLIDADVHKRV